MTSKYTGNHLEVTICDLKILSLKDLGKKWFAFSKIDKSSLDILGRLG